MLFLITIVSVLPLQAKADGGPVVGPHLWAFLKEGQQIAVVTLLDTEEAEVDLFISLLDDTGESHEITFFVPLGVEASHFGVFEESSYWFDQVNTRNLDRILREEAIRKHEAIRSLFGATLLTNGVWLLPLWLPVIFSGCAAPPPEATFETDSSQVSIYGLDDNTDLEGLINTTGLDPSVKDTLSRLRGQRIAVVNFQTKPQGDREGSADGPSRGEPGIHLSWTTSLVQGDAGGRYSYPLGTGDAWYHPIELTRVYVVGPPGLGFSMEYPRLGAEVSGYEPNGRQYISEYYHVAGYAVDEAAGDFGRVWRAIYTQSNASEDIIITARPQSALSKIHTGMQGAGTGGVALLIGLVLALSLWILSWRYLMPRLLRGSYKGNIKELWRFALIYTGANIVLVIPGVIIYLFWSFTGSSLAFAALWILFGGVSVVIFATGHIKRLGENTGLVIRAFVLVTLVSNGAYLVLSLIYATLTGII